MYSRVSRSRCVLGPVHVGIGKLDERSHILTIVGVTSHADRSALGCDVIRIGCAYADGLQKLFFQLRANAFDRLPVVDLVEQNNEFIPP